MRLVIASRKSDLARIQAYAVGESLKKKHLQLDVKYEFRESLGDKNLKDPLWKMPEKGVFTEDFYQGLISGQWDMVVHSWKDLPVEWRAETTIAATLDRADMRDVLLLKKTSLANKKKEIKIYTSSPRRVYNLTHCLSDLLPFKTNVYFDAVRGNVQTRVRKLLESDADGLILAKAGLDRLLSAHQEEFKETRFFLKQAMSSVYWMVLPLSLNPTAAAQGALAIEIASHRHDLKKILENIHCNDTYLCAEAERQQLKKWGGGCHQKIGINRLLRDYGTVVIARGQRDTGETIDILSVENRGDVSGNFQQNPGQATWFERRNIPYTEDYKKFNAHWIARANALPEPIMFDPEATVVWTSGVETWKRLAARGLWVNGTSDSMGEQELPRIGEIDMTTRRWCKWTHTRGEAFSLGEVIPTYELVPKDKAPFYDPTCEHFYWMSGSSFEQAIEVYPWLVNKSHWSGPGSTHKKIENTLKNHRAKGKARIALNLEQWQKLSKT